MLDFGSWREPDEMVMMNVCFEVSTFADAASSCNAADLDYGPVHADIILHSTL